LRDAKRHLLGLNEITLKETVKDERLTQIERKNARLNFIHFLFKVIEKCYIEKILQYSINEESCRGLTQSNLSTSAI